MSWMVLSPMPSQGEPASSSTALFSFLTQQDGHLVSCSREIQGHNEDSTLNTAQILQPGTMKCRVMAQGSQPWHMHQQQISLLLPSPPQTNQCSALLMFAVAALDSVHLCQMSVQVWKSAVRPKTLMTAQQTDKARWPKPAFGLVTLRRSMTSFMSSSSFPSGRYKCGPQHICFVDGFTPRIFSWNGKAGYVHAVLHTPCNCCPRPLLQLSKAIYDASSWASPLQGPAVACSLPDFPLRHFV